MAKLNAAFYKFITLRGLHELRQRFRDAALAYQLKGTIILSPEGVNGFVVGEVQSVDFFVSWVKSSLQIEHLDVKKSFSQKESFKKLKIKLKQEIIPLGDELIDPNKQTAPRVSPEELKEWIETDPNLILLDTRNHYEIAYGSFQNAVSFDLKRFRDFPISLREQGEALRDRKIVLFCTGGIRCEKATAVALRQGFKEVFQLDGGILNYFEKCGGVHYKGRCFVFDERVSLNSNLSAEPPESSLAELAQKPAFLEG